jgi:hypothetical protein
VVEDRLPCQVRGAGADHLRKPRLGDRARRLAVLAEIAHLARNGTSVGRDGDCPDRRARVPGDDELRAVIEVDQNPVAWSDGPALKAGSKANCILCQFAVRPVSRWPVIGQPHERDLAGAALSAHLDQIPDVGAAERVCPR